MGSLSIRPDSFRWTQLRLPHAVNANFPAFLSALGTSTTGGFLQTATNLLSGIEDPTTGVIKTEETNLSSQITTNRPKSRMNRRQ